MAKYLIQASYSPEGVKGLLKEGATPRQEQIEELADSLGGELESFYFAFGEDDVFVILNLPDNISTAAMSLAINASGFVSTKTTVLLCAKEMDEASRKDIKYRPPGVQYPW